VRWAAPASSLRELGTEGFTMLTGDHAALAALAAEIARQTGIDRYRAPEPPMFAASKLAPLQLEMLAAPPAGWVEA
jgi:cation transport ATPase